MPLLRLIGLTLFITSIFLGLAALATKTTHIRFGEVFSMPPDATDAVLDAAPGEVPPSDSGSGSGGVADGDTLAIAPNAPDRGEPTTSDRTSGTPASDRAASGSNAEQPLHFVRVPIIWPITGAGALGLLLWFLPAPLTNRPPAKRRRRRRRRATKRVRRRR